MSQRNGKSPEILRVGVIGCGVGRVHTASFKTLPHLFQVTAVCDLDPMKAQQVAAHYAIPDWYTDIENLYAREDIDVIDICTPPFEHHQQILGSLSAGKHVICEKPLVGSLAEVDQLAEAEQIYQRRIMPILQYRFGHGLQKLKRLVKLGIAGRLFLSTVEVAWRRRAEYYASPWRGRWETELGGTLLNHAIHHLDMLCTVSGPIHSVFALTASLVNPVEVEDTATISLQMANGSLATLSATLGSVKEISRHRFCFENLTAESNTKPYSNSDDPWTFTGDSEAVNRQINEALESYTAGLSGFEQQFSLCHAALQSGGPLPVDLEDARSSLEIMTAIYDSSQTHRLVPLPISRDHPRYRGWAPAHKESL